MQGALTSKARLMRERMRPLAGPWLDLLVLRLMNEESTKQQDLVLCWDELASLQRLPQATTAVTENREVEQSDGAGASKRRRGEALYGHVGRRCCRNWRRRSS